jgi:hypothetical protein
MWKWIWPRVGPSPISQNTDSEMFDRSDYPYTETFVREAIQNTLDARLDPQSPAIIYFRFHRNNFQGVKPFLDGAIAFRRQAGVPVPPEWDRQSLNWLTIEDFNTKGLDGQLDDRLGSFWGYWLNFGLSNKDGHGRGGRGIGRVSFLIASRIQTVIGLTRRDADKLTAASGMTMLKPIRVDRGLRSTHAYLANAENADESIYDLHDSADFHNNLVAAFGMDGYGKPPHESGLALAIPYPHDDLTADGILASAIEHFAPAILSRSLTVRVDDRVLDSSTIESIATEVADRIRTDWIKEDVGRYVNLVCCGITETAELIDVDPVKGLMSLRNDDQAARLRQRLDNGETIIGKLRFDLERGATATKVTLTFVAAQTPEHCRPADRLFREGMSLPDVKASSPGEIDLLLLVDDGELATYLNFCEGKAHLDLLESKEVKAKLEEKGYHPPARVKRFVKALPHEIRSFLTSDITEPETDVFDTYFSIPDPDPAKKRGQGKQPDKSPDPPPPPPEPRVPAIRIKTLDDGFELEANPDFTEWPVNVSVTVAYADGSRNPSWVKDDFELGKLDLVANDCDYTIKDNKLTAKGCGGTCSISVKGFDNRRELETRIKVWRNAQDN